MRGLQAVLVWGALATAVGSSAFGQVTDAAGNEVPDKYLLDYPAAIQCCPPVESTFAEAQRTFSVVRGKRFRHKPNGGYGLPVIDQVAGQNLLHVGADLGWHQVGAPVFAVASGVVRLSTGPEFKVDKDKAKQRRPQHLAWGNFVVIEHRFAEDQFVTTVYGHLGPKRLVKTGDVVQAGEQIGTIGRQHARINGGYTPHLHFGVRPGRLAEVGASIARLRIGGRLQSVKLAGVGEQSIELDLPSGLEPPVQVAVRGRPITIESKDGKAVAPASLLWGMQRQDFPLVGYDLSLDGWRDPVKFLREHRAHTHPARFRLKRR